MIGFLLYVQKYGRSNYNLLTKCSHHHDMNLYGKKNNTGNDERYLENEIEIQMEKYKIAQYFEKKRLLDTLENKNVSIYNKLKLLRENNKNMNNITPYNLHSGGLMKHFDFRF